jgi:ATP-dependent 26S proteasome regulatory subunit
LSDGLLSDCLNIQIIATFNTDLLNIDEALLRKGRLIAKYEFKELTNDRKKNLSKKLNIAFDKNNQTLAEIYNSSTPDVTNSKPVKIGFKTAEAVS